MAEDEKAAWFALDGDAPLHRGLVAADGRGDRDRPMAASDRSSGNRSGPSRRRTARSAAAIRRRGLDEDAQSARARDVVGIARDGKELVEGRVADRELRAEHAVHPRGGAQDRLVGQPSPAPLRNERAMARAARRAPCRAGRRGDLSASVGHEERQELRPSTRFDMRAPAVTRPDLLLVRALRRSRRRVMRAGFAAGRTGRPARALQSRRRLRHRRLRLGRRRSTPPDDPACRRRRTSTTTRRRARASPAFDCRAAHAVSNCRRLEARRVPNGRANRSASRWAGPITWRKSVAKPARAFETAVRGPRMRAALRQVLPAHQHVGETAHAARRDDRDTGSRRPRCSSGSPGRQGRDPG